MLNALVVLPNGEIRRFFRDRKAKKKSGPSLEWFLGAEGTMGIITEVELQVRRKPEKTSRHLISYDNLGDFCDSLMRISELGPFFLAYSDSYYRKLIEEARYKSPTKAEYLILVNFEGDTKEVEDSVEKLQRVIKDTRGVELSKKSAEEE